MGVTLLRALCTAMLKRHALGSRRCSIVPRIRRELPVRQADKHLQLLCCCVVLRKLQTALARGHSQHPGVSVPSSRSLAYSPHLLPTHSLTCSCRG